MGDTLFAGSIGRTDLPGGDLETLLRSIRKVLFSFPGRDRRSSPGHGEPTTIGKEKRTNPFLTYCSATMQRRPAPPAGHDQLRRAPTPSLSPSLSMALRHPLAVDERAVGALEISHFAARSRRPSAGNAAARPAPRRR